MKSASLLLLAAYACSPAAEAGQTAKPTAFPTTLSPTTLAPTSAAPTTGTPTTAAPTPQTTTVPPTPEVTTAAPTAGGNATNTSAPTGTSGAPTAAPTQATTIPAGLIANIYNGPEMKTAPVTFLPPCYKTYDFRMSSVVVSLTCAGRQGLNQTTAAPTAASNSSANGTTSAPTSSVPGVVVWTVTINTKTVSCGQNVQVGVMGGVLGGPATLWTLPEVRTPDLLAPVKDVVVCAAYTTVSEVWAGITPTPALLTMDFWVQPQPANATSSAVYCATQVPTEDQRMNEKYPDIPLVAWASGSAKCVSGQCKTSPLAMVTCQAGGNQVWFDQGVGMSVGGVGLILTTIAMILLAGRFTTSM